MTTRRAVPVFAIPLFFFLLFPLYAQEPDSPGDDEEERPPESIWTEMPQATIYQFGDQIFGINLGAAFPALFFGPNGTLENNFNPAGGTGCLAYDMFLSSFFAVGGEIMGLFAGTIGKNQYYLIPMGIRATFQFVIYSFEFPVTLSLGMAPQKYLDESYFGAYAKAQLGAYWRFRNDWSFGLNVGWLIVGQWVKNPNETAYGNFITLNAAARFHL